MCESKEGEGRGGNDMIEKKTKMAATSLSHIVNFDLVYVTYAIVCITAALIK